MWGSAVCRAIMAWRGGVVIVQIASSGFTTLQTINMRKRNNKSNQWNEAASTAKAATTKTKGINQKTWRRTKAIYWISNRNSSCGTKLNPLPSFLFLLGAVEVQPRWRLGGAEASGGSCTTWLKELTHRRGMIDTGNRKMARVDRVRWSYPHTDTYMGLDRDVYAMWHVFLHADVNISQ